MLVYGDQAEPTTPGAVLERVSEALRWAGGLPAGLERHAALVESFIEAGLLAQGVADAEFAERGCDARSPAQDACMALLTVLARAVLASWRSGFAAGALPIEITEGLHAVDLPREITVKRPEGYAFYALYPEAYAEAASPAGPAGSARVIGIRSIGTGLAAMVAVGLGASAPVTVRPVGHPFRRELRLDPALAAELAQSEGVFAIVDEGPGLSGSSFGAVADFLEARGVPPERIVFFPSHGNDLGPQASQHHRQRWAKAKGPLLDFDTLVLHARNPAHRLETWIASLVGPLEAPLQDISGGVWRTLDETCRFDLVDQPIRRAGPRCDLAPVHAAQERRKFLARAGGRSYLAKFAGLGGEARRKLALAQQLHEAGFTPEPIGLRHGFLIERWEDAARRLDPSGPERPALLATLPCYLGFRARAFEAGPHAGASLPDLFAMLKANAAEALGETATACLEAWRPRLEKLGAGVRRVRTDNRLHAFEWLVLTDGRLLKTDALDHHAAHDLVGCQDLAWDVAGAFIEFDLSEAERGTLIKGVSREAGRALDPALVAFCERAYAAFQLGLWTMAAGAASGGPEEPRLHAMAARYARRLQSLIAAG